MNQYDFLNLNPNEFEILANDLLSRFFNTHIEIFKPGKDLGIDGRFFCERNDQAIIIQSKHYAISGFKKLISDLVNVELPKIKRLALKKYVLATSVPLSPQDKENIKHKLHPFIENSADIFGKEDLNSLLRKFPDVEKNHYKLWISSSTVLMQFLNAKISNISQNIISEAYRKHADYVTTKNHSQAKEKILATNVLVITGDPGVGKTTLAEQLCLEFVADGYTPYVITTDVDEGLSTYLNDEKQLFYFDDFLGKNYIETLRFNEDSKIMQFINMISRSKNKKFILTSRTTILDQGYRVGPSFKNGKIKNKEYVIDISNYKDYDKARILYSFLWRSDLSKEFLECIIKEKSYLRIIYHRNFNPRLLEFITSKENVNIDSAKLYLNFIHDSLDNPEEIWSHPYNVQLDAESRTIVDLIVFGNGKIDEFSLKNAFNNFSYKSTYSRNSNISKDFYSTISILTRSFVKKSVTVNDKGMNNVSFSLFNPSISDFIISKYSKDYNHIADIIMLYEGNEGLCFLEKATWYHTELAENVSKIICERADREKLCSNSYYLRVGNLLNIDTFKKFYGNFTLRQVTKCIKKIEIISDEILGFCSRILQVRSNTSSQLDISDIFIAILNCKMNYNEIETLSSMLKDYSPEVNKNEIVNKFYERLLDAWMFEKIDEFATENIEQFTTDYSNGVVDNYAIDKKKLASLIENDTAQLYIPISIDDAFEILLYTDLDEIAANFYQNGDDEISISEKFKTGEKDIHSIFDGFLTAKFG